MFGIISMITKKRVRHPNGKLTPIFKYPIQAFKYIEKYDMKYATIFHMQKKPKQTPPAKKGNSFIKKEDNK